MSANKRRKEKITSARFWDTIKRTIFIMVIAVIFTRILDLPLWVTIVAVLGGVAVIIHALYWIRKLKSEKEAKPPVEKDD